MATIKEQYRKARRNYLRRVNNKVRQGYMVDVIPIPKNPTRASIRRLQKMTGAEIARTSTLVDMLTGEIYERDKRGRRKVAEENRKFNKLTPFEQETARAIQSLDKQYIKSTIQQEQAAAISQIDVTIQNFYDTIEQFRGDVQNMIRERVDAMISTEEGAREFAYIYQTQPELFPDPSLYDEKVINGSLNEIAEAMKLAPDNPDYQKFVQLFDGVEREG